MAIYEGSRYQNSSLIIRAKYSKNDVDGVAPTVYLNPYWLSNDNTSYKTYIVKDFDRLDQLAYNLYGSSELWWAIARINPELLYVDNIPQGTVIRLPA